MTIGTLVLLSLCYAAVAALLLNLNLATRHGPWIKGGAIVVVSLLYAGTWYGTKSLLGWASADPLPEEFRVLWISMEEPDKSTGAPGVIYFWVRELDEAGLPIGPPRAHRIGWDESSAEAAHNALKQMEEGEPINGRMGRNLVDAATPAEEGARYAGDGAVAGEGGRRPDFEFVRVPPPTLPVKGPPAS